MCVCVCVYVFSVRKQFCAVLFTTYVNQSAFVVPKDFFSFFVCPFLVSLFFLSAYLVQSTWVCGNQNIKNDVRFEVSQRKQCSPSWKFALP